MVVQFIGEISEFPDRCACCGAAADSVRPLSATLRRNEPRTWNIPYCAACIRHVRASDSAIYTILWANGMMLVVAIVVGSFTSTWLEWYSVLLGYAIASIGLAVSMHFYGKYTRRLCSSNCAYYGEAVRFTYYGEMDAFDFRSREFAVEFMALNRDSVVNPPARDRSKSSGEA